MTTIPPIVVLLYHIRSQKSMIIYKFYHIDKNFTNSANNLVFLNKKEKSTCKSKCFYADGRSRTGTVSLPADFESATSANSITAANSLT